jgi:receptor protein-tyrosine kinase
MSHAAERLALPAPENIRAEKNTKAPTSEKRWFGEPQNGSLPEPVPSHQEPEGNGGAWSAMSPMLVMAHNADWFSMEQYRYLRTHIKQASRDFQHPVILVTSAHPGEGKSVTASNLAVALALESQEDILLIDGELRKPDIHTLYGLERSPGFANVLAGTSSLEEVIQQGPATRLKIIPAGETPKHPADLLGSGQCEGLFAHLRTRFAYTIIDSPPLLTVTDGRLLSHWADGVLLVVRAGATRQDAYQEAARHLGGQRMFGVVVNGVAQTYFAQRYGSRSRYGYYGQPEVKSLPV